jgi:hypothetical protein
MSTEVGDRLQEEREQLLEEMTAEHGPNWISQYEPGSPGCHELLDRTLIAAEMVEQYVLSHPACIQNEAWYRLAERAVSTLHELYQQVGAEHLANEENSAHS